MILARWVNLFIPHDATIDEETNIALHSTQNPKQRWAEEKASLGAFIGNGVIRKRGNRILWSIQNNHVADQEEHWEKVNTATWASSTGETKAGAISLFEP